LDCAPHVREMSHSAVSSRLEIGSPDFAINPPPCMRICRERTADDATAILDHEPAKVALIDRHCLAKVACRSLPAPSPSFANGESRTRIQCPFPFRHRSFGAALQNILVLMCPLPLSLGDLR
jgi:hypothetical protein